MMQSISSCLRRTRNHQLGTALLSSALTVMLVSVFSAIAAAQVPALEKANAVRYLDDVRALTAPAMEGRGDDTKGIDLAAGLLEQRYKDLGLDPAGTQGYLQPFQVITGAKITGNNDLIEELAGQKKRLRLDVDFVPFSFSATGEVSAPLVFAGYGVSAQEFGYDDYGGVDVKDKIVLLLRYEPPGFAAQSGNHGSTRYASLITKAINARNHGAKAVVIINGKMSPGEQDQLVRFGSVSGPNNTGIVLVQVKNSLVHAWFREAGKSLAAIQKQINSSTKPASFVFPERLRLAIEVSIETTRATVNNVIAFLPGRTDEYIVIGAHYDHLGYGHYDSLAPSQIGQIHPGADDNASGTAGVLELAQMFAPLKGQLRRGILFASFAGEELGLLGSADWIKEPTRPLGNAIAMLNMDMIGRIANEKIYIGGVGTGSTFSAELERAEMGFPFHIENSAGGYASSDHTSFVASKIPVLFFFSGLHSDYHRPSDTWNKINATDAARLVDMIGKLMVSLDISSTRPNFVEVLEHENSHTRTSTVGGGYGPYFGSIPDFGQSENGVRFSDVQPDSPAAKAGLTPGDVLVQFGEKKILNLYDFTDALRDSKVGDVVEVTVLRGNQRVKTSVRLEQRH